MTMHFHAHAPIHTSIGHASHHFSGFHGIGHHLTNFGHTISHIAFNAFFYSIFFRIFSHIPLTICIVAAIGIGLYAIINHRNKTAR